MNKIKEEIFGKNPNHAEQHGRSLLETKPYVSTADKMGLKPSQQLLEKREHEHEPLEQHGRGYTETSRFESTADKQGLVPSEQLRRASATDEGIQGGNEGIETEVGAVNAAGR